MEDFVWRELAQRVSTTRRLSVAVLGCSTTAGCGAADPSPRCDRDSAWPQLMRRKLNGTMDVVLNVHAKNAVSADYFSHCTEALLPTSPPPDVVLLEVFQNLFGPRSGLNDTIVAVRRATTRSKAKLTTALAFVDWTKQPWHSSTSSASLASLHREIKATSAAFGIDVVGVSSTLHSRPEGVRHFYARNGHDHHPSRLGHMLIADAVSAYLIDRLHRAAAAAAPASVPASPQHEPKGVSSRSLMHRERCYPTAPSLPIAVLLNQSATRTAWATSRRMFHVLRPFSLALATFWLVLFLLGGLV